MSKTICPICDYETSEDVCETCGYEYINKEFDSVEKEKAWNDTVIQPARAQWRTSQAIYIRMLEDYHRLVKKKDEVQKEYGELVIELDNLKKNFESLKSTNPAQPITNNEQKPGWNTVGRLTFPTHFVSHYKDKTNFEIFDANAEIITENWIKVTFYIRLTSKIITNSISFRYKLIRPDGYIAQNGTFTDSNISSENIFSSNISFDTLKTDGYKLILEDDI